MTAHHDRDSFSVSVVIPAYNSQHYIARAIQSVLAQTFSPSEIIVVDDGSTDRTGEVVQAFGEKVRYIYQPNAGAGAARNRGILAAKYDWVAFLDADDEWLPERLEQQRRLWLRCRDLVWMGANYYCYSGLTLRRYPRGDSRRAARVMRGKDYFDDFFAAYRRQTWGCTITVLIRREIFEQAGMFDESLHYGEEDTDLWWRIAYRWPKFGYLDEPLAVYHVEISDSLMKKSKPLSVMANLIDRHMRMAVQYGRLEAFRPVAAQMLRVNIREFLFEDRGKDIRCLVSQFRSLFPFFYRVMMRLLTVFPGVTANACFGISHFIRFFNLRRQVIPHPRRKAAPKNQL